MNLIDYTASANSNIIIFEIQALATFNYVGRDFDTTVSDVVTVKYDIQKQKTTGTGICTTTNPVIYTNGLRQHAGRRRLDGTSGRSSYRSCYCISNI